MADSRLTRWRRERKARRTRRAMDAKRIRDLNRAIARRVKQLRAEAVRRRATVSDRLWGGSRAVTNEVIRSVGGRAGVTSRKRMATFGNPGSDHHVSQLTADAVDFDVRDAYDLADEISQRLGGPRDVADFERFTIRRNGRDYRVQIIAGPHGGTGPHLHVGVRRI